MTEAAPVQAQVMNNKPLFQADGRAQGVGSFFTCNAPVKSKIEGKNLPRQQTGLEPGDGAPGRARD